MTGNAVGNDVEQCRTFAGKQDFLLPRGRVSDCQRVVTIHPLDMHLLGIDTGADPRGHVVSHGLARGLTAHTVMVVHDVKEHWRGTKFVVPQFAILIHGRHPEALPHRPAAQRCIADIGNHDPRLAVDQLEHSRANRYVGGATDNCIVGHGTERGKERVHRTTKALVDACLTGKDFGQRSIKDEVFSEVLDSLVRTVFDNIHCCPVEELVHDAGELLVVESIHSGQALGQDFTVRTMRAEYVVLRRQVNGLAHRSGFLSDRQMCRSGVIVFHTLVGTLRFDQVEHGLKLAHYEHVVINLFQSSNTVLFHFLFIVRLVLHHWNRLKCNFTRLPGLLRADYLISWHETTPQFATRFGQLSKFKHRITNYLTDRRMRKNDLPDVFDS